MGTQVHQFHKTKHTNGEFFNFFKNNFHLLKENQPQFQEGMWYKTQKNKIEIWKIVIPIPKEQQAIIAPLEFLEGNAKAEKAAAELTATDVNNKNGMKLLIEKSDKIFESDKIDEAYLVYSSL